jgi:hypothetical protein
MFTCGFFIPFIRSDRANIVGDGYCFYRALYALFLRSEDGGFELSAEQMKEVDEGLRLIENDTRLKFHAFFETLHNCLPEEYGKSRVRQARFLFFYILNCGLDERFWGILDGVAYLPFNCTGFGEHTDPSLSRDWLKYYCSSLFGMVNGSASIDAALVGSNPSFADIAFVLGHQPNYVLFKSNHFFVSEHKSVQNMQTSFDVCLEELMSQIQTRFSVVQQNISSGSSADVSPWSDLFDRMQTGVSTPTDAITVRKAVECLKGDLQRQEVETVEVIDKIPEKKKKNIIERVPIGATDEQKKIITLNMKVKFVIIAALTR